MTINKVSGEVPFPAAGEGAYFQFTTTAFERLEAAFDDKSDDGYINYIISSLARARIPVYRQVVAVTLMNSDPNGFPWGLPLEKVNIPILDALYLAINGRTYEEQIAWNEEQTLKRLKGLEEDPRMAELLRAVSSIRSGQSESEPT